MFPSSSNNCDHFPFTNQLAMVSENEIPCSSQQHPSMFLHDQPTFADDNELFVSPFFSQQQILGYGSFNNVAADEIEIKIASPVKTIKKTTTKKKKNAGINGEKKVVPQKRTGKKDRHSKIYTAQGPRDRRMRLSLQIARKFFDLQDMLGFDKASKTIDWLFSKSKAAIKELMENLPTCTGGGAKSLSSSSESEVVSGINKIQDTGIHQRAPTVAETWVDRKSRKSITNLVIRESRDKARARARERTVEKMKMKMKGLDKKSRLCSEEPNPNNSVPLADHSVSTIEKFLGITTSPRSSSIFDYTHNVGESSGASSQEKHHVYAEYNNYCAFTNMKESTGNLRAQNLGEIFNINPDTQDQESSSIYMSTRANAHEQNPNSDFNKAISNAHEQNPSSIWQINPIVDNQYCSFY